MHNAPTVSYPLGRSAWWGAPLVVLWLAGVAALAIWCASVDALSWRQGLDLALWLLFGGWSWRAWRGQVLGELSWTGTHWLLVRAAAAPASCEGLVSVQLDLQHLLLLRFTPVTGPACWLLLQRATQPERWQDLRRAVYSRARTSGAQASAGALPDSYNA